MRIDAGTVAADRWRSFGFGRAAAALLLMTVNTVRLGAMDHMWPLAITLDVILVPAIAVLSLWLRRRAAVRLAESPPGTLYAGGVSFLGEQFRTQPQFNRFLSGATFRRLGCGWMSGSLVVTSTALVLAPGHFFGRGLRTVSIPWGDVEACELTKIPGKVNVGGLDLRLRDGSNLSLQARGFDRLSVALDGVEATTRPTL